MLILIKNFITWCYFLRFETLWFLLTTFPKSKIIFFLKQTDYPCKIKADLHTLLVFKKTFFHKKLYGPFWMAPYVWGSTVLRLQGHYKKTVYFLPFSFQEFLALNWSTSEGWKAHLILESHNGFETGTSGLGIPRLNH